MVKVICQALAMLTQHIDDETSKSMLQRFIFTFKESKVDKNQIEEFDLLKNSKDTFY